MEELIKPFIKSSREIITQIGSFSVEPKKPYLSKEVKLNDNLCVVIGITGTLKGQVLLNFSQYLARKIASNMMGGIPVVVLDDMAKSAIAELGNMILGNAAALLFNTGTSIDITPPSILEGADASYWAVESDIICVPFETEGDKFELNIYIDNKKIYKKGVD